MKDKMVCEKYNNCWNGSSIKDKDDFSIKNNNFCCHSIPHYYINGCSYSTDSIPRKCGNCVSIKELRKLKLEKINGSL